jgi:hypothetical protein|tara:strand:+ start:1774 stop:2412 length:639 start_codon:yes stop_codon:yes gene_type:complete
MKITRGQLKEIVSSALNESILLSLLIGCKSECNLSSIAPELKNLKIPECVTEEIYDFENIDWGSKSTNISDFKKLVQSLGYSFEIRRNAVEVDNLMYDDIVVGVKNVPYKLVIYLVDTGIIRYDSFADDFGDDELCDLLLYFIIEENENNIDIVVKNSQYVGDINLDIISGAAVDTVGHSASFKNADIQCNENFKAVVANINPKITADDTGY